MTRRSYKYGSVVFCLGHAAQGMELWSSPADLVQASECDAKVDETKQSETNELPDSVVIDILEEESKPPSDEVDGASNREPISELDAFLKGLDETWAELKERGTSHFSKPPGLKLSKPPLSLIIWPQRFDHVSPLVSIIWHPWSIFVYRIYHKFKPNLIVQFIFFV